MKKKIPGNRYDFIVKLQKIEKIHLFEILSVCKKDNKKSTITNLNFLISELIAPILNTNDIHSTLCVNKQQAEMLFSKSLNLFNDKILIKYLEKHLDVDRGYGGWNSNFKI